MQLPLEIKYKIIELIPFEKITGISDYIAKRSYNPDIHSLTWAAKNGYINAVKWIHKKEINNYDKRSSVPIDVAADNNHLDIVKFLYANRTDGCIRCFTIFKTTDTESSYLGKKTWIYRNFIVS